MKKVTKKKELIKMDAKNDFMITINKHENYIKVLDDSNKEIVLPLIYPTIENSAEFWECASAITAIYSEVRKKKLNMESLQELEDGDEEFSSLIKLSGSVVPYLTKYIIKNIEYLNNTKLTDEQKNALYILITRNLQAVLTEFVTLFNGLLSPKTMNVSNSDTSKN